MSKSKEKVKKSKEKKEHAEMMPVFRLKPIATASAMSKYIGNIKINEQLVDQEMEMMCDGIDKTKLVQENTYLAGQFYSYEIVAKACICNISGSYIIKNNKLPVYYVTLLYEKRFVSGQLFTLFVYFTLDSETEKKLISPQKYVNRLMTGKFTLELASDESFLPFLLDKKKPEIETELMTKYLDDFDQASEEDKAVIMEKIATETNNKLNKYRQLFDPIEIEYPKKSTVVKKMIELLNSDIFKDAIYAGLEQRENDRREKSCPDSDYKIPKNIINLKEIKDNPEKLDEIISKLSDADSDNDD